MSSDKSGGQFLALIFKSEGQTLVNFLFCLLKCWNHFVSSHVKRWVEVLENINQSHLSIVLTFSKLTLMSNWKNCGKIYPTSNLKLQWVMGHDPHFYFLKKSMNRCSTFWTRADDSSWGVSDGDTIKICACWTHLLLRRWTRNAKFCYCCS